MANSTSDLKPESQLVTAGRPEGPGSPLNIPLTPASTFMKGGERGYAREDSTPSWAALEEIIGQLDGGEAVAFSSGMAAAAAVLELLPAAARIAIPQDVYQGVAGLLRDGERKDRWQVQRIATDDTQGWLDAMDHCQLLWLESPSNPLLLVADLVTICAADRPHDCLLVIDNTFATPLNQQPLLLGADISMQSVTKYIGGHSDLLGGILSARKPAILDALKLARKLHGATPGTLEAFLAVRGVRTMAVRLERAQHNALQLAQFLDAHPAVENVRYPGLTSHPQHALAAAQLGGFGAIISFEIHAGAEAAEAICDRTRLIRHATSLGAVESTMERRAAHGGQEHIPAALLRLSVGIEAVGDLQADLAQALMGSE